MQLIIEKLRIVNHKSGNIFLKILASGATKKKARKT